MSRRKFLKASAVIGAGAGDGRVCRRGNGLRAAEGAEERDLQTDPDPDGRLRAAQQRVQPLAEADRRPRPGEIRQGRRRQLHSTTSSTSATKARTLPWLVEDGVLTMAYQSSSYFTGADPRPRHRGSAVSVSRHRESARRDGRPLSGRRWRSAWKRRRITASSAGSKTGSVTSRTGCGRLHAPADMKGHDASACCRARCRSAPSTLLGATPRCAWICQSCCRRSRRARSTRKKTRSSNTTTYGVHKLHKFHTASNHFYLSRPIFFHRTSFDAWPKELQDEMRAAVPRRSRRSSATLHVKGRRRRDGGDPSRAGRSSSSRRPSTRRSWTPSTPIYGEARGQHDRELAVNRVGSGVRLLT